MTLETLDGRTATGKVRVGTVSGSEYLFDFANADENLVTFTRLNENWQLRRDSEKIRCSRIVIMEVGRPLTLFCEYLGQDNLPAMTVRSTSIVTSIDEFFEDDNGFYEF